MIKGSFAMPEENDSPFLLDRHRRGLPNLHKMARYPEAAPVDLVVVGAGAGGITLAQRLARQDWPWGDPHSYPHAPHPVCGAALRAWEGAEKCGIEMRVGPVSITNGVFGNRPHCIYRGFCLEGCKVNSKASPLITHLPDGI